MDLSSLNPMPTLTIGIAAYNESANITHLLRALLEQHITTTTLERIVVISDGSSDQTVAYARGVHDPRIEVIDGVTRVGKSARENEIVQRTTSDVLVILDADTLPLGAQCIDALVAPILRDPTIGLVAAATKNPEPRNGFERMLNISHLFKIALATGGSPKLDVYLCAGVARAFARSFYCGLHWDVESPEDAFSYFACLKAGFKFTVASDATVIFRQPNNFRDYRRQSARFAAGPERLIAFFGTQVVRDAYRIPLGQLSWHFLRFLWQHPALASWYATTNILASMFGMPPPLNRGAWEVAESSKKVF